MYFKLSSAYTGEDDISFVGTVSVGLDEKFIANPQDMPYVAGSRGDGLWRVSTVAELTSSGATLNVGVFGFNTSKANILAYMQAISVEYAWVDESV